MYRAYLIDSISSTKVFQGSKRELLEVIPILLTWGKESDQGLEIVNPQADF